MVLATVTGNVAFVEATRRDLLHAGGSVPYLTFGHG